MKDLGPQRIWRADDAHWDDGEWVRIRMQKMGPFGTKALQFFRLQTHATMNLDDMASAAWRIFDGRTVAEVLAALDEQFDDEPQMAHRLGLFISRLSDRKLVKLE